MAGYSARQSSFTTGDTITAAHSNDEFNQVLAAFNATTGHTHDGTAGEGGPVGSIRDADSLNKILVDSTNNHLEFYVEVSSSAVQQFRIQDGAIVPITDNDIDLGTSSLEFKDLYIDGTANIDTLSLDGTAVTATGTEINLIDGGATVGTTAVVDGDGIIHNDGGTMRVTSAATFKTYFQEGISTAYDDLSTGDAAVNIATSAGDITIDAQGSDTDIILKGTDGGADTTFLTIDGSAAGKATFNSDVVVGGDLTVTGDDIIMGTNTAGNLLIADGTNFNSIAVGSLSEISTVANDDVFLAVDTSGGGLKKIARSAVVAGLATSGAISNVVEDTTPQLGGSLDVNGEDIVSTSNGNITITPNGSGVLRVDGSNGIDMQSGSISIKNSGTQSYIDFYCESSNAHYARLQAPAHSAFSGNITLTLPATTDTVAGLAATQTFTNKTLTTPVIAEIDSGSTITLDATTDIVLDADGGDVFFKDGGTTIATLTNSSSDFLITTGVQDKDFIIKGDDGGSAITALTIDMSAAGAATFNDKIIATELDISGDVDVDGTLEADAITVDGTSLAEFISDTTGAMFSSNTETGITATYQDGDNTIDLALDAAQTTITSLLATDIKIGEDDQTKIDFETADTIHFYAGNQNQLKLTDGVLAPVTDNDVDLGTSSLEFKNVYVDGTVFADAIGFGTTAMTLPTADGNADQILTTNGSGTLSFVDNSGGTSWQSIKTSNYTASAGEGVFANTSGGAFTVTLPSSPSLGDEVSIVDYAGSFDTYNLTVGRNSQPIMGVAEDLTVATERAGFTLVYVDSTQGWLLKDK